MGETVGELLREELKTKYGFTGEDYERLDEGAIEVGTEG